MTGTRPRHRPTPNSLRPKAPSLETPKTEVQLHTYLCSSQEEWQAEYARVVEKWGLERTVLHDAAGSPGGQAVTVVIYTKRPILTGDGHLILSLAWPYRPTATTTEKP